MQMMFSGYNEIQGEGNNKGNFKKIHTCKLNIQRNPWAKEEIIKVRKQN